MRKFLIFALIVLIGVCLVGLPNLKADEARVIKHKFRAFSSSTAVTQGATIFRITGYATAASAKYAIHNIGTLVETAATNVAVEGGEGTSGDALLPYDFGPDGLTLDSGMTVVITGCVVVVEYI